MTGETDIRTRGRSHLSVRKTKTMGWLGYEARRLGRAGMVLPVVVMLGFG